MEPHVLKEKYFLCIVCDFSTFYHNCTFCGTCSIYFLSSFALHFILLYSIQISKWFYERLLKLHSVREDVPFVFYQTARCSYHNCIHPSSSSSSCIVLESYPWLAWILYWNIVLESYPWLAWILYWSIVLEYCTRILYWNHIPGWPEYVKLTTSKPPLPLTTGSGVAKSIGKKEKQITGHQANKGP